VGRPSLLLVEDDPVLVGLLSRLLTGEGYDVTAVGGGKDALDRMATSAYSVVVLDRGLPDGDGLAVLRCLRQQGSETPVLVLTALGAVEDRVAGLDAGAEDYLVKPFAVDEFLARLRALRRRPGGGSTSDGAPHRLGIGRGWLDLATGEAVRPDGVRIALSRTERDLLETLARSPGRVFGREDLRDRVFATADTLGAVDTYVYYLRRKLGHAVIHNVRGLGYRAGEIS
jgi:two-component system, OmpR family, response regulator